MINKSAVPLLCISMVVLFGPQTHLTWWWSVLTQLSHSPSCQACSSTEFQEITFVEILHLRHLIYMRENLHSRRLCHKAWYGIRNTIWLILRRRRPDMEEMHYVTAVLMDLSKAFYGQPACLWSYNWWQVMPLMLEVPGSIPARSEENFGVQTRLP